jgi:protein subunit release factor B
MLTEKHQEFHKAIALCSDIEAEIAEAEERVKALKAKLVQAEAERDTKASDAAEELHEKGFIMIQMPDMTNRPFAKAKKRKGGAEPTNKFVVRYEEKFDASMRRITGEEA